MLNFMTEVPDQKEDWLLRTVVSLLIILMVYFLSFSGLLVRAFFYPQKIIKKELNSEKNNSN